MQWKDDKHQELKLLIFDIIRKELPIEISESLTFFHASQAIDRFFEDLENDIDGKNLKKLRIERNKNT